MSKDFIYERDSSEKCLSIVKNAIASEILSDTPTWSGCHSLVSSNILSTKKAGFIPVIPNPITKAETVYTCLINFKKISSTLKQKTLPIFCDEGVYQYTTQIYLHKPELFDDILVLMGAFHTAKAAMKCAGKFLRGCGVEDTFIECRMFGPNTVETVLSGGHYYRSWAGLLLVADAIEHLRAEEYWKTEDSQQFVKCIEKIDIVRIELCKKVSTPNALRDLSQDEDVKAMMKSMDAYAKKKADTSEQCKFWEQFLYIISLIKDLIKADRNGDFLLHMQTVIDLCPVFGACGSTHYFRYGSFYAETLKQMKTVHPELYLEFMKGGFVIKRNKGSFNAVSPDMALEQTIQRSAKSTRGIIGKVKSQSYCAEWTLIHHDILSIANAYRSVMTSGKGGNTETTLHNQLASSRIKEYNSSLGRIVAFMKVHGNPYSDSGDGKLKNFVTQVHAQDTVAKSRLEFQVQSKAIFEDFHNRVFVEKSSKLLDRIPRTNLPHLTYIMLKTTEADKANKFSPKSAQIAIKSLLIAKEKTGDLKLTLSYDITSYSYLFDGEFMTKPNKAELIHELRDMYFKNESSWSVKPTLSCDSVCMVDFMAFARSFYQDGGSQMTFGSYTDAMYNKIVSANGLCKMFHLIFDSYIDGSIKG